MSKTIGTSTLRGRVKGFSLIEVVVSVLVLSIGALGLAAVQISAKRAGHEALQRTVAASLAADMIERMRINASVLSDYHIPAGVGEATGTALGTRPGKDCSTVAGACTSAELAVWDLWEWERALNGGTTTRGGVAAGGLVNPMGCVTVTGTGAGSGSLVEVEIAWQGSESLTVTNAGNDCGAGSYETNDVNRQLLQITSYIIED